MLFQFAHIEYLFLLILIPAIIVLYLIAENIKKKQFRQYGEPALIEELMPEKSSTRPTIKLVLILIGFAFFVLALAGPQFGSKLKNKKVKGIEIIVALDVSNSMLASDIEPNRLERAKQALSKLIDRFKDDKIGLIVFAGDAMTQMPITADYVSAKMFLSSITPDMVPVQGTAIGKAIKLAMVSFTPDATCDKAIIVITDGENHEDDAVEAAKEAKDKGIYVNTIGIGSLQGAPIPIRSENNQISYITDEEGKTVISKLDQTLLENVASNGGGIFVRASNAQVGLNTIFDKMKTLKKGEFKTREFDEYNNQYQWPLAIALVLFFVEIIILERKTKWSGYFNLFQV